MTKPLRRGSALRSRSQAPRGTPRILTAVPICDGHDSPIITINFEFARHGIEVIYLGYHRSTRDIVRAAIQEDVHAIGISSYNGGHIEVFTEVLRGLGRQGAGGIAVFGGGGGTITPADARLLKRRGVDEIFFAGTTLDNIVAFARGYGRRARAISRRNVNGDVGDLRVSRMLTAAGAGFKLPATRAQGALTVGITGPGGAGKTTLIDELALRFLNSYSNDRLAILSHDPSLPGKGALLGDRATMVYANDDRVFMRSMGTSGHAGGLSTATRRCLDILKQAGFRLVIVESAGIGQEDAPFVRGLVDKQVLVMSPDYGSRLQLQKIVMLESADVVVINKADLPGAQTAFSELEQRLTLNAKPPKIIHTIAKRHRDPGVDDLFEVLVS